MNAPMTLPPPTWTTGSTVVFKTGTWRSALPLHREAPSPCREACPVGGEVAEWIGLARRGDLRGAFRVLTRHNPFPAVAGRVCHHPCESACNRSAHDEAVSICRLERHVGDHALAERWPLEAEREERSGHVAVVGGGPAGLSAAYQLRRRGWRVTLFEAGRRLGGLMASGIPSYRLSRAVLDGEIERIVALGVELRLNSPVATPEAFDALRAGHDAVFVATGAARPKRLPAIGATTPGVVDGATLLAAANGGAPLPAGERVVVVGGGSAAFDAARSLRRAGRAVTMLTLESRAQLPAQPDEVDEAIEEGVAIVDGAMLRAVHRNNGAGLRIDACRVNFTPGRERGRFEVQPLPGSDFAVDADTVVVSIGQDPELSPFAGAVEATGGLLAADEGQATPTAGVWAGGDVSSLARYVTQAVGMGERAALDIHRWLLGEPRPAALPAPVPYAAIAHWYHPQAARAASPRRGAADRLADGGEVQLGLGAAEAVAEAARCFSCGHCIACDQCVTVCPDLAVRRAAGGGYEVLADWCKGCGLCVHECPTGAMAMQEERR